jgi:hypothetical protein
MSLTKEEAQRIALYAAGKVAMAARMVLNATPHNMSSRSEHLETLLDDYDRKVLEISESHPT